MPWLNLEHLVTAQEEQKWPHEFNTCLFIKEFKNMKVCITNFQKQVFKGKLLGEKVNKYFPLTQRRQKTLIFFSAIFKSASRQRLLSDPCLLFVCLENCEKSWWSSVCNGVSSCCNALLKVDLSAISYKAIRTKKRRNNASYKISCKTNS